MGKDHGGPLTAKAIGKKIKAKGLQKLKFYCQMCQKQCRDANGFKCHTTSEAHQRQLLLFAENPGRYLGTYSDEFLKDFLYLLRTRFSTRRVNINTVYQEHIKDRDHTHLNSTRWVTLTGLAKWLGRKGICHVEEAENGWYVTYIDRDPETLKKQENAKKNDKLDKDYEERLSKIIEDQIERGKKAEEDRIKCRGEDLPSTSSESKKELTRSETDKVVFCLSTKKSDPVPVIGSTASTSKSLDVKKETSKYSSSTSTSKRKRDEESSKKKSALEELKEEREREKAKKSRVDHWLSPGIVVKVTAKSLGDKYYKKKGIIKEVVEKYSGVVEMIESGDRLKLDQTHLETVIPNVGRGLKVLNGPYTGASASLLVVNFDSFSCKIKLDSGPFTGRIIDDVSYEDVSKTA